MMHRRSDSASPLYLMLLAVIIFVTVNLVANRLLEGHRLDLTEHHLYTLSEGTKQVLSALDEPLTVRMFYTEKTANGYPAIQNYAQRIKGLLKEYAALSQGKLRLEIINPEPFSEAEDLAVSQGVRGVAIDTAGKKLFFGLTISNALDNTQTLAFLTPDRQAFIEYDITRLIDRLRQAKRSKVGLLSWLPMRGTTQSLMAGKGPWAIYEQMDEFFDLDVLKVDVTEIPKDVNVLVVAHPSLVSDQTLYAIDQFMMRGGSAIFLVDPYTEVEDVAEKRSSLEPLLSRWGVRLDEQFVAGDVEAAIQVAAGEDVSSLGAAPNISWLLLKKPVNFNQRDVLTAQLNTMVMPSVGIVEPLEEAAVKLTPLITTGEAAFLVDKEKLLFSRENPSLLLERPTPSENPLTLAARVEGIFKSAFSDKTGKEHLARTQKPGRFIVVADTDFLRDGFWVQKQQAFGATLLTPSSDNGAFLLNAIDYLSGDSGLLSLRTRTTEDRRFVVVDRLRRAAEERFRDKEESLRQRLREAEAQIAELQSDENGAAFLTQEQQKQLDSFRDVMVDTRRELRQLQYTLRQEIEALGTRLKLIHVGLIPLFVLFAGFWLPRRLGMKRS
jgi:ABC-type uncharacterized transport system involved in gliding motility auxiliary subunit